MKYFALTLFVCIVVLGCQSETKTPKEAMPKILDWNKTPSEQNLQIGDTITVKGIAYNLYSYKYNDRAVFSKEVLEREILNVASLAAVDFSPEMSIPLYNLDQPDVESNPNVPIGAVVCTVYNPMHNVHLKEMYKVYPYRVPLESKKEAIRRAYIKRHSDEVIEPNSLSLSEHLIIQHKFEVKGTIQGFERRILRDVSLLCIDVEVSDLTVTESKKVHEKLYDPEK